MSTKSNPKQITILKKNILKFFHFFSYFQKNSRMLLLKNVDELRLDRGRFDSCPSPWIERHIDTGLQILHESVSLGRNIFSRLVTFGRARRLFRDGDVREPVHGLVGPSGRNCREIWRRRRRKRCRRWRKIIEIVLVRIFHRFGQTAGDSLERRLIQSRIFAGDCWCRWSLVRGRSRRVGWKSSFVSIPKNHSWSQNVIGIRWKMFAVEFLLTQ